MIIYMVSKKDRTYLATPSWEGAIKAQSYLKVRGIRAHIKTHSTQEK
jgi:hypothetical protein